MSYQSTILASVNLNSFWPLDETSGTTAADLGPFGPNNLTYVGGPALATASVFGQSCPLFGTGTYAEANTFGGSGPWGMDILAHRVSYLAGQTGDRNTLWAGDDLTTFSGFQMYWDGNTDDFIVEFGDSVALVTMTGTVPMGVDTYIAINFGNSGSELWIDGVMVDSIADVFSAFFTTGIASKFGGDAYSNLRVACPALYFDVLTPTEIGDHYAAALAGGNPSVELAHIELTGYEVSTPTPVGVAAELAHIELHGYPLTGGPVPTPPEPVPYISPTSEPLYATAPAPSPLILPERPWRQLPGQPYRRT